MFVEIKARNQVAVILVEKNWVDISANSVETLEEIPGNVELFQSEKRKVPTCFLVAFHSIHPPPVIS